MRHFVGILKKNKRQYQIKEDNTEMMTDKFSFLNTEQQTQIENQDNIFLRAHLNELLQKTTSCLDHPNCLSRRFRWPRFNGLALLFRRNSD